MRNDAANSPDGGDAASTPSAPLDDLTLTRRDFLRVGGAAAALAGLDGCTRMPAEHILPYVDNRPELTPGVAQHYATAMCIDGYATGVIVESHEGRPTKIEGNPDHPASLGASGAIEQASVLQLYDPDRAQSARIGSSRVPWSAVAATLAPATLGARTGARTGARGAGLRLLIEPTSSPLDEELLARVLTAHPGARIHMYAPLAADRAVEPTVRHYDISSCDVMLAVDSDFLATGPFHLRYARQFADNRRLATPTNAMSRLYVVESSFTPTGTAADHRFAMRPRDVAPTLRALLALVQGGTAPTGAPVWLTAVARDLTAHRGRSVVIVGDRQTAEVRALGDAINAALGAEGHATWRAPSPLIGTAASVAPFSDLVAALQARTVDTLVIVGGNPSYATPASLNFSTLLRAVPNAGYAGLYENETARDAHWFVPLSHYLESWGDARAYDGTLSLVQPLINPLYQSITPAQLYSALAGDPADTAPYDLLRASWAKRISEEPDDAWATALQRGVVEGTAFSRGATAAPAAPAATGTSEMPEPPEAAQTAEASGATGATGSRTTIDVVFLADPKLHDGTHANNGWLQELPAPLTQLTWGNAALLSPATARRLGVTTGGAITLSAGGRSIALPALLVPGHADDTATVHFGYGRSHDGAESQARGVGANAYTLWPALGAFISGGVTVAIRGAVPPLNMAQTEAAMENGTPVRRATLAEYRRSPTSVGDRPGRMLSLYPEPAPPVGMHGPNQWAMTIDLGACIGCGACVVACQAENNIPVVGAEEVRRGRQMHWIRIDRYFAEREAEVEALVQPMLCQHCEKAPCEYVCPVEATVHSADGLNEMIYNRCVGTRFCSNNCPYKVRRFNWFDFNAHLSETELMVKNPNVTVRERGVMEKCSFCVQRIRGAEIAAGREGRTLRGSEVQTACQQTCPTNAIVFGSLTEPESEMMRRREQPRAYAVLRDLGTEPRVRYLARVRNTNPDVGGEATPA
jgi:molybdopterin-containing oxidoreductase family iron-sulfur binding subunit